MTKQEDFINYIIPKNLTSDECRSIHDIVKITLDELKINTVKELDHDQIINLFKKIQENGLLLKINVSELIIDIEYIRDYIYMIYTTYETILMVEKYNLDLKLDLKDSNEFEVINKDSIDEGIIINKFVIENLTDKEQLFKFIYKNNVLELVLCDDDIDYEGGFYIYLRIYPSEYLDISYYLFKYIITKDDFINKILIKNKSTTNKPIKFMKEISENDIAIEIINNK